MARRASVVIRVAAIASLLVWLALAGLGGPRIGKLSGLQENDQTRFLAASSESSRASEQAAAFQTSDALPLFVIITQDATFTPDQLQAAGRMVAGLAGLDVADGLTVADVVTVPPAAVIPAKDGKALLIPISLNSQKARERIDETPVTALVVDAVQSQVAADLPGTTFEVTGPAAYVIDLSKAFAGIDGLLLLVALGVVFVILVLVYRSPILPFAVLISAVFGLSAAGLVVYELASRDLISISGQSQGILSILVVGAATDYALLMVSRFREELRGTESSWGAMKKTWRATVEPIGASALTVILGLLCLLFSDLGSTRSLGPISAIGIVGALLAALTFLPAILLLAGRRIFWPRIPQVGSADEQSTGVWGKVAALVSAHPRRVWVITAAVLVLFACFAPSFRASGLATSQLFRISVPSVTGEAALKEHFPANAGSTATVVVPTDEQDAVIAAAKGVAGVQAAVAGNGQGPAKVIDGRVLVSITLADEAQSRAAEDSVAALRTAVRQVDPDLLVGGQPAQALDTRLANERDVRTVMPAILAVVFVVLAVLLRSLVAPTMLVVANLLSFLATLGVSAVVFNQVFKFPDADPSTPLYAFVFLIALGVDYSIFLMTRIREEVRERGPRDAVVHGLTVTGGVITSAGIVLAATFAALFVIPLVFMAQIAFLVAFGVLLDTFVVRSLLVSGLAYDLGRWSWWPSRLFRQTEGSGDARGQRA